MNSFSQASGVALITIITVAVNIVTTVFWIVVGWRAMRAHEELAESLRERTMR